MCKLLLTLEWNGPLLEFILPIALAGPGNNILLKLGTPQIQPFAAVEVVKLFSSTWVSKKYTSKAENISIVIERTCVQQSTRMPLRLEISTIKLCYYFNQSRNSKEAEITYSQTWQ